MNHFVYVSPDEIWSNYHLLPENEKIRLTEKQYRKQLKLLHGYIPESEDDIWNFLSILKEVCTLREIVKVDLKKIRGNGE